MIAETFSFEIGHYVVWQKPRFDNPAWPQYVIFRGEKLIGKSFSMPDLDCCRWLERQRGEKLVYATSSWEPTVDLRGATAARKRANFKR